MKRTMFVVAAAVTALGSRQARAELKLEEAIKASLESNERSRVAALRIQTARGQLDRARSAFFPTLTLGAGTTVTPYTDRTGRWRTTSTSLTLNQPILNPSAFPQREQAAYTLEAEQHGAVEDQRQLAFSAARAFIQALAAERVRKAADSRFERAKANLDNTDARAKAGLISTNDATRARIDLASAAQSVAQSKSAHQQALLQLGLLMGRSVGDSLTTPEGLIDAAKSFQGDVDRLTRNAIEHRPDLRALRQQIRSAEASAAEPRYRMLPSINLSLQVRSNIDALPTDRRFDESMALNLNWTLFDNGSRYADRRVRTAQVESLRLNQQLQFRTVKADIQSALVQLEAARQSLVAAEEGVVAAQANTDETAILYQQGLARAIELTDANARRFDADVNLATARQSLAEAYLQLRLSVGLNPVDALVLPSSNNDARYAPVSGPEATKEP